MDRIVEARFSELATDQWALDLVELPRNGEPERPHISGMRWRMPTDPDKLFLSIVPRSRCRDLHGACVRLRVRPDGLEPDPGPMPPVLYWPAMFDAVGLHVYLKRWTLAEVCAPEEDQPWPFEGSVTVVGDPSLTARLREAGLASVHDAAGMFRAGTLLIIAGRLTPAEVTVLQQQARTARCPLVVWTDTIPKAPGRDLLELVPTGAPTSEPTPRFLARLVRHLRAGHDPEAALALTASEQPPIDLRARWLRGTFRPWRAPPRDNADERLRYWRSLIDRSVQQAALTAIVNDLVAAEDHRRVHVVVVRGVDGAGVDYFRQRPIDLRADLRDSVQSVPWEPDWDELPAQTFDKVIEWNLADDLESLVLRLVEQAREGTLLVRCIHSTASAGLDVEGLRGYIAALKQFAAALSGHPIRVLVLCCVVTADPTSFEPLEDDGDAACAVSVLSALEPFIPDDELWDFLRLKGIVATRQEFRALRAEMGQIPYESLVEWLVHRFPDKLVHR